MHFLTNLTHRGFLMTLATSAILLTLCGSLVAHDKSPSIILSDKAADTTSGSSRYYDGKGRYAGRSSASASTTRLNGSQGRLTGRICRRASARRAVTPPTASAPPGLIPELFYPFTTRWPSAEAVCHVPQTDQLFLILDRAGWSIGDSAFLGKVGTSWLVFRTNGDHSIQAHG